jgi:hypothetical protein
MGDQSISNENQQGRRSYVANICPLRIILTQFKAFSSKYPLPNANHVPSLDREDVEPFFSIP